MVTSPVGKEARNEGDSGGGGGGKKYDDSEVGDCRQSVQQTDDDDDTCETSLFDGKVASTFCVGRNVLSRDDETEATDDGVEICWTDEQQFNAGEFTASDSRALPLQQPMNRCDAGVASAPCDTSTTVGSSDDDDGAADDGRRVDVNPQVDCGRRDVSIADFAITNVSRQSA